jgi:hypothetical protein
MPTTIDRLDALDAGSLALAAGALAAGQAAGDPERVAAEARPVLDWLAQAIDQDDLHTRMVALKRHMTNLDAIRDRLKSLSLPVTGAELLAGAQVYYGPLGELAARVCRDTPGMTMTASRLKLVLRALILGATDGPHTWPEIAEAGVRYARNHTPPVDVAELDAAMMFLFGAHGEDIFPAESTGTAGVGGGWAELTAYPPPGVHGGERYDLALPGGPEPEAYRVNLTRAEVCKELDRVGPRQLLVRRHGSQTAPADADPPGQGETPASDGQAGDGHTGAVEGRM